MYSSDVFIIITVILFLIALMVVIGLVLERGGKTEALLAAEEFGTNVSISRGGVFGTPVVRFEYNGAVFTGKIFILKYYNEIFLDFDLPFIQEKFLIRTDSPLANLSESSEGNQQPSADSRPVSTSALPENYLLYSLNEDFLLSLLADEKVISEIVGFDSESGRYVKIWFDTGHFQIRYRTDNINRREKFRQVCRCAVLFHDRINSLIIRRA